MTLNPPIKTWEGKRVWVIGASTGIGAATARLLLERGALVALSARNKAGLEAIASDYQCALPIEVDITDRATVLAACDAIMQTWQGIDQVLIVAGAYNEMRADSFNFAAANMLVDLNIRGIFSCLDAALPILLRQGYGGIGIVSSVAGYSGLPKALVYGPTKAALINLAESLYFDLHASGIGVYLINPGFVETPLTAGNDFPMPALVSASFAAQQIVKGMERGEFHIHFPKRFTNWLRLARLLPYRTYFWLVHKVTGL
jgi:NAD(P)-dependent dehydrogenase (short-subunit alcohol dehydrogenase family)